jgi:DNA-binding transcriptional ArsR family regulator
MPRHAPVAKTARLNKRQLQWICPPKDRPWARLFIDVIDGEHWRGLSVNARRVLDALIAQHFLYCQKDNGDLQISYRGFEKIGVTPRFVGPAIRELKAAGMVEVKKGIPHNGIMRPPSLYEIVMYRPLKGNGFQKKVSRRFVWVPIEVMESPGWRGLSLNARRILDRLLIENLNHKSETNGGLRVSYRQFVDHGVTWRKIGKAIRELIEAGLIEVKAGEKRRGPMVPPNTYRLTFLGTTDGPPTWKRQDESKPAVPQKPETNVMLWPKRKAKLMSKKLFPTPRSEGGATPLCEVGNGHFPPPEVVTVDGQLPPPEVVTSYICCLSVLASSTGPLPPEAAQPTSQALPQRMIVLTGSKPTLWLMPGGSIALACQHTLRLLSCVPAMRLATRRRLNG